ncbi:hypothetical protein EDB84DRAFT_1450851 [Lactarius hengduanensis]|nr:hypothetical protein EDB84DRAFT_1450851 [Lactarius hengduanensis]
MARFSAKTSSMDTRPRRHTRTRRRGPKRSSSTLSHHSFLGKARPTRTVTPRRSRLTFIYVGNLSSDVTNADLEKLFGSSGKITKIDIRCGFGAGAVPGSTRNHTAATVYATILFDSVEAATRALAMNGRTILDRKIIASPSFLDMPEAQRGMRRKPFKLFDVDLTNIGNAVHHAVDKLYTGGTHVFPSERADV